MQRLHRRDLLRIAGVGATGTFAGCIAGDDGEGNGSGDGPSDGEGDGNSGGSDGDGTGDGGDGDGSDDSDGNGDGDGSDGSGDDTVEYDLQQVSATLSAPPWYDPAEKESAHVALFDTAERARRGLEDTGAMEDVGQERAEAVHEFIEGTEFDRSALVFVASEGPSTCYSAIEVRELGGEDGTVTGTVAAKDTAGEGEGCGGAHTHPSALVRVSLDGSPPDRAALSVIDGWGEKRRVEATAADPVVPTPDHEDLPGHVHPDEDPRPAPVEVGCDGEFERHWTGFEEDDLEWGDTDDFALRVDRTRVVYGDEVRITLTNIADGERSTGNRHKYNLQAYTTDGWREVRGSPDGESLPYTDEAVVHPPGEGFEWPLRMDEEGVVEDHVHADSLEVCDLPPARYRFVYFGTDPVVVSFDVVKRAEG